MSFADEQVRMLESTGLWPYLPYLPLKRYSDEKARYEVGVLRILPKEDARQVDLYQWFPEVDLSTLKPNSQPAATFSKGQVQAQLFDTGWMVD